MKTVLLLVFILVIMTSNVIPAGAEESLTARRIRAVENGLTEFAPGATVGAGQVPKHHTLAERMSFHKVPGVSVAVIDRGRVEWAKGYGVLRAGSPGPVTTDSLFEAASTTKAVVAAIVLQLAQEGKLDLDVDVNHYLKTWRVAENEFTRAHKVTPRLLLSHRAGLPATNFPYDEQGAPPTLPQVLKGEPPAGNKAAVVELPPGSKWQYSNIGYVVVQQLLEDVLGRPLESIARERVFAPLGMSSSTFAHPLPPDRQKSEALPHDGQGAVAEPAMHPSALAQGGLMTTPTDLARFACELLLAYGGRTERLLTRASVRRMLSKEVDLDPRLFGFPVAEGLGIFVSGGGASLCFSHPGSNYPGATCWLLAYPELGQGAVIMTNGAGGELLTLELISSLAAAYNWPPMGG